MEYESRNAPSILLTRKTTHPAPQPSPLPPDDSRRRFPDSGRMRSILTEAGRAARRDCEGEERSDDDPASDGDRGAAYDSHGDRYGGIHARFMNG